MTPRQWLAAGALFTVVGLAVAGTAPLAGTSEHARGQQVTGGAVVLAGWALLAWGIHRVGRSGDREDEGGRASRLDRERW